MGSFFGNFLGGQNYDYGQFHSAGSPSKMAIIYRSELDYMSRCILDYPDIETGGQLFGFWTNNGTPVVLYAIGPGKDSKHRHTAFFQDLNYLHEVGGKLISMYGLQHMGEWHSHHQLDLARPSGGDVQSIASGLDRVKLPRMLLCIGNCTPSETEINAFNFHVDQPYDYRHAAWSIVEMESPFRAMIDSQFAGKLIHPRTETASYGDMYIIPSAAEQQAPAVVKEEQYWLFKSVENVETMQDFEAIVKGAMMGREVKVVMNDKGEAAFDVDEGYLTITIPKGFPAKAPIACFAETADFTEALWNPDAEDLVMEFMQWFSTVRCIIASNMLSVQQERDWPEDATAAEDGPDEMNNIKL